MIKVQSLRIGNAILFSENNEIAIVAEINTMGVAVDVGKELTWIEADQFEPIPLSEDWLLRLGFEEVYKSPMHSTYWMDGLSYYFWYDNKKQYADFKGAEVDCQHLHQLQNLYWCLVGRELEIVT